MPEAHFFEQDDRPVCAAFSPDGRFVALGGYRTRDEPGSGTYQAIVLTDGHSEDQERSPLLCVIDRDRRVVRRLATGHRREVCSVAFSEDGDRLFTGSGEREAELRTCGRDGDAERLLARIDSQAVVALAPLPGDRLVAACCWDAVLQLRHSEGPEPLRVFEGHARRPDNMLVSAAASADGTRVASGDCLGEARVWHIESGACLGVFREPTASALRVALDATGRWLATGGADHRVALWDVERGERVREFAGHTAPLWAVSITPDGAQIVSGSYDQTLRLWDAGSGRERVCLKVRGPVLAIRVAANGSHAQAAVRRDADVRMELPGGVTLRS